MTALRRLQLTAEAREPSAPRRAAPEEVPHGGIRFRPAETRHHALESLGAAIDSAPRPRSRAPALTRGTDPLPRWRMRISNSMRATQRLRRRRRWCCRVW
jgi:hypothetical protein